MAIAASKTVDHCRHEDEDYSRLSLGIAGSSNMSEKLEVFGQNLIGVCEVKQTRFTNHGEWVLVSASSVSVAADVLLCLCMRTNFAIQAYQHSSVHFATIFYGIR